MDPEVLVPLGVFAMVVLVVWIRETNAANLRAKLLDTFEKSIEKGVDPAQLQQFNLPIEQPNPYGNLKAGIILIFAGVALFPLMVFTYTMEGADSLPALGVPLLPIILGIGFLVVHKITFGKNGKKGDN